LILPDVNVLLYSFIPDSRDHRAYRSWLSGVVNSGAEFGMSPRVLSSVIRIATHSKIYVKPQEPRRAIAFATALLRHPRCRTVQPGIRHWSIFCGLCETGRITGNLVQDAWFAALAIEHGCEWVTADRDFGRFPGLRWRFPV
jgi:toxin-antitoxin system PIN domain toxin